jgi:hypothetical protein
MLISRHPRLGIRPTPPSGKEKHIRKSGASISSSRGDAYVLKYLTCFRFPWKKASHYMTMFCVSCKHFSTSWLVFTQFGMKVILVIFLFPTISTNNLTLVRSSEVVGVALIEC